ncbi:MAG: WGR domain-containing protein [Bryobacteraceae bacterium]
MQSQIDTPAVQWGRIGSSGQTRSLPFPTPQEAEAALDKQRRAKEHRGYSLTPCCNINISLCSNH